MNLAATSRGETSCRKPTPKVTSIVLSTNLFSSTLSRQSLFHALLLARLQVEGVTLHFLNYVFRLNLALEPTQGILQRLTLLQSNFCQTDHPQTSPDSTNLSIHHSEYPSSSSSSSSLSLPSP